MDDLEAREERAELVSRTFALITAKLEDAATLATECQGRHPPTALRENAENLRDMLAEAITALDCVIALLP